MRPLPLGRDMLVEKEDLFYYCGEALNDRNSLLRPFHTYVFVYGCVCV